MENCNVTEQVARNELVLHFTGSKMGLRFTLQVTEGLLRVTIQIGKKGNLYGEWVDFRWEASILGEKCLILHKSLGVGSYSFLCNVLYARDPRETRIYCQHCSRE
jgi:hypothetical protein